MTSVESDSFDDTVGSEDSVGTLGLGVSEYVLESETDDNQSQEERYFNDDPQLPIFNWKDCEGTEEIVSLLMSPPSDIVCKKGPLKCEKNASFLIDTRSLKHPTDWKSDDLGSFHNVGCVSIGFFETSEEVCFISKSRPPRSAQAIVQLRKTYWTHSIHKDFKRRSYELWSGQGKRGRYILLQYEFDEEEHPVRKKPHGNAKSSKPFARTKASTLQKIKAKSLCKGPSQVYDEVFKEANGLLGFESLEDIPKGRKQVENVKFNSKAVPRRSKDELCDLVEKSKLESEPYIRRIQVTPEPACILATEQQIKDLKRFCTTNTLTPSVFCVDTTFNIGDYYVTATTYRHLMLTDVKYGGHPTMLGPCMLHMKRKQESYNFLASSLVSIDNELSNIVAIGSDRDAALRKGIKPCFPIATWLCCKKHVEDDVTRKLLELRIGESERKEFLLDIFGSDAREETGLIDACSCEEFDVCLESLYPVWIKREMEARGLSKEATTEFYSYFLTNVASDMKTTMIKPVRERIGLGENFFYNNDPESMNDRIKKRKGKGSRKLSWTECVDLLQGLAEEQARNGERALINEGPYQLSAGFAHMKITPEKWLSLSSQQKERKVSLFRSASTGSALCRSSNTCTTSQHVPPSEVQDEEPTEEDDDSENPVVDKTNSSSSGNLTVAATMGMPKSAGRKPGSRGRCDKRPRHSPLHQRCTKEFTRRAFVTNDDDDDDKVVNVDRQEKYQLKSLKGTSIYVCYGCGQRMRPKPSDETGRDFVPPAPFDVVFYRKELRMYKKPSGELTYSITPQNVYYHMKKACIQKKKWELHLWRHFNFRRVPLFPYNGSC